MSPLRTAIPIVTLVLVWQLIAVLGAFDPQLFPRPVTVARAFLDLLVRGDLLTDIIASLQRVLVGFLIALAIGTPLGLFLGTNAKASGLFTPILELLRPIPPIAWIPLAILWFGLGNKPAYFLVFLGAFFPIFTNALFGATSLEERYRRAAYSLGATKRQFVVNVLIPASLPHVFAGLRIGLGVGWIVVITAELVGAQSGLGYMIQFNRLLLETPKVIAGMITIGLIGFLLNRLMIQLENKLIPWKRME